MAPESFYQNFRVTVGQSTVARCAVLPRRRWGRINTCVILSPAGAKDLNQRQIKSLWLSSGVVIGIFVYGSLEAGVGWGSGEAQVISDCSQKNRCQCQFNGCLGHLWSEWRKQSFLDGEQAFLGVFDSAQGDSKRAVLMDMN